MKAERPYPQVHITQKGERALTAGHPWVYAGEVTELSGPVEDGGLADVMIPYSLLLPAFYPHFHGWY